MNACVWQQAKLTSTMAIEISSVNSVIKTFAFKVPLSKFRDQVDPHPPVPLVVELISEFFQREGYSSSTKFLQ